MLGSSEKKKRKRSRWQSEEKKMIIPGMPMCLPTGMSEEQRTTYISMYFSFGLLSYYISVGLNSKSRHNHHSKVNIHSIIIIPSYTHGSQSI